MRVSNYSTIVHHVFLAVYSKNLPKRNSISNLQYEELHQEEDVQVWWWNKVIYLHTMMRTMKAECGDVVSRMDASMASTVGPVTAAGYAGTDARRHVTNEVTLTAHCVWGELRGKGSGDSWEKLTSPISTAESHMPNQLCDRQFQSCATWVMRPWYKRT